MRNFSIRNKRRVARFFLLFSTLGPGIALALDSKRWGSSPLFQQLSRIPYMELAFIGYALIFAAILILIPRSRDIGYMLAAVFYALTNVSAIFAIFAGKGTSALIFTLPLLLWIYLDAIVAVGRYDQGLDSLFHPTPDGRVDE